MIISRGGVIRGGLVKVPVIIRLLIISRGGVIRSGLVKAVSVVKLVHSVVELMFSVRDRGRGWSGLWRSRVTFPQGYIPTVK